jgi:tight adherence protein B
MSALLGGALVVLAAAALRAVATAGDRVGALGQTRLRPPAWFARALADTALPVSPEAAWTGWLASGGIVLLGAAVVGGASLGVVVVAVVSGAGLLTLACLRGRAARLADAALPEAVDALARALRTGATLAHAVAEVAERTSGPLGDDLRIVAAEVAAGSSLVGALDGWAARAGTPGARLVAAAAALSAETGGAAARALDGVAATLRANRGVLGELHAQSAQARLSALVIALAPLAFGVLALGTDRRSAAFLLGTPVGLACLLTGLALDGVAAWWMQRITASVT